MPIPSHFAGVCVHGLENRSAMRDVGSRTS
jgi:hypothetical protein